MKKKSRLYYRRRADKIWSERVVKRAGGLCEVCSSEGYNKVGKQAHHIIGKKNLTLRHDLRNGINLCYTHHVGGKESAHNDPIWFLNWMDEYRYEDYLYLNEKRTELATQIDYEEIIKKLNDSKKDS